MGHGDDAFNDVKNVAKENERRTGYNKAPGIEVPSTKSIESAVSRGIFTEMRVMEKPLIFLASPENEKPKYSFYSDTTHYYFPTLTNQNYYHVIFKKDVQYSGIKDLPVQEFPRPDFMEAIWRHIPVDFYDIKGMALDLDETLIKTFSKELQKEFREMKKRGETPTVETLLCMADPFKRMPDYLEGCKLMYVSSRTGAFLDILSPDKENIVSIAVERDELEREREYEYQRPVSMEEAVHALFYEYTTEFNDERTYDNDNDGPEYGELEW